MAARPRRSLSATRPRQPARVPHLEAGDAGPLEEKHRLGREAVRRQRKRLEELRNEQRVGPDVYLRLQEELDFLEVSLSDEHARRIEES